MASEIELDAMHRAVALSRAVLGTTSPNPPVGAVILDAAGVVVGQGATQPPGGPHAEIVALQQAGSLAAAGTAVVTLEPCRHAGRTGPCTAALRSAGVARVVLACTDPTESAGGGAEELRRQGVDVEVGVSADDVARGPLEAWLISRGTGRPFVTWKFAATLDGRSAAADGTSRWVTGEHSRADVHRLRAEADAVVAGVGTVLADDPLLTARPAAPTSRPPHQPLRVVVDSRGRTPLTARVLSGPRPAVVAVRSDLDDDCYPDQLPLPGDDDGHVDLLALLAALQQRDVVSILLEGGPTLAGAFVRHGLVDRVVGYLAPALLGDGPAALRHAGVGTIADVHRFRLDDVTRTGEDVRLTMRRQ